MQRSLLSSCLSFSFVAGATLAVGVAVSGCGAPDQRGQQSEIKILGGRPVADTETDARRWSTVALTTDLASPRNPDQGPILDQGHSFCSGTIISDRVIMTAAHCLQKFDDATRQKIPGYIFPKEENFLVYFGTQVKKEGKWIRASKVIPHPDWEPSETLSPLPSRAPNDIGLVVLSEKIPEGYKAVGIASKDLSLNGKKVILAGFGVSGNRNRNDTGLLRAVQVGFQNANASIRRFGVGAFFRGACAGDSGGPAYVQEGDKLLLIGATSTGAEIFGQCLGIVNNYTDVRHYMDWIDEVIVQAAE